MPLAVVQPAQSAVTQNILNATAQSSKLQEETGEYVSLSISCALACALSLLNDCSDCIVWAVAVVVVLL